MGKLILSPHDDDSCLFVGYQACRGESTVLVSFDSHIQVDRGANYCNSLARAIETVRAMSELSDGACSVKRCNLSDAREYGVEDVALALSQGQYWGNGDHVWAPAYEEGGHDQHNLVALAAPLAFPGAVIHRYTTYVRGKGKTRTSREVIPEPWMIERKLRALACFSSQIRLENTRDWFLHNDLAEFLSEDSPR